MSFAHNIVSPYWIMGTRSLQNQHSFIIEKNHSIVSNTTYQRVYIFVVFDKL